MSQEENENPIADLTLKEAMLVIAKEEAARIKYGKIYFELTVCKGEITNIQADTRRSVNVNYGMVRL